MQTFASDDMATYESMEAALRLLRQHRLDPRLQQDISRTLEVSMALATSTPHVQHILARE